MKNVIKVMVCSIGVFCSYGQLYAQEQDTNISRHEVSVNGGLGLSTLKYDVKQGSHKSKMGHTLGFGYTYHIDENFGIKTGLEFVFYKSEAKLSKFADSYRSTDTSGEFNFNTSVNDYSEKQQATYLNIPIMGQYQWPAFNGSQYYVAAGFTVGIPLSGKYKTSGASFKTTGSDFDYIENPPIIEDTESLGFYSFEGRKINESLKFNIAVSVSLEAGVKWKLVEGMNLYTGIYTNYGVNDIRKGDKNKNFLVYEPPYNNVKAKDFQQNSILHSQISDGKNEKSMTGKVRVLDLGLKLRLSYDL